MTSSAAAGNSEEAWEDGTDGLWHEDGVAVSLEFDFGLLQAVVPV